MTRIGAWILLGLACGLSRTATADVFVLSSGGQVEGELVNRDESPRQSYVVKSPLGGTVTLARQQVDRVISRNQAQKRYEELLPKMRNTAEDHGKMADWCMRNGLDSQREHHFRELLKLDPDHEEARRILGFQKRDGRWVTTEELMTTQGYVRHQGVWRLRQDLLLQQAREQAKQDEITWKKEVRRLRKKIDERNGDRALEEFRAIRHPAASPAIAELLADRNEPKEMRRLYVDMLAKMDTGAAIGALTQRAIYDADDNVRDKCLDHLVALRSRQSILYYQQRLEDKDNQTINRAASALGRFQDRDTTLPLIEALVTKHKQQVGGGAGISPVFTPEAGGLSMGGGPKVVSRDIENPGVLAALTMLHPGVNFGYDKAKWKAWFADANNPKNVQLRRDQ